MPGAEEKKSEKKIARNPAASGARDAGVLVWSCDPPHLLITYAASGVPRTDARR